MEFDLIKRLDGISRKYGVNFNFLCFLTKEIKKINDMDYEFKIKSISFPKIKIKNGTFKLCDIYLVLIIPFNESKSSIFYSKDSYEKKYINNDYSAILIPDDENGNDLIYWCISFDNLLDKDCYKPRLNFLGNIEKYGDCFDVHILMDKMNDLFKKTLNYKHIKLDKEYFALD